MKQDTEIVDVLVQTLAGTLGKLNWAYDPTDDSYTYILDHVRCRVWRTTLGNWAAVIIHRGISTAAYNFATPEDAKTWCETQARGSTSG